VKVSENVEKGGAVLKMVSSSTGFLKGMMELSLAAAAANITSSHAGNVNDGSTASPETDDNKTTPSPPAPRPANGPSLGQSSVTDGSNRTESRRFGKRLAWLQRRCRRSGAAPPPGEHSDRYWWRRRPTTTKPATPTCPTSPPKAVPPIVNVVDLGNNNDRQDAVAGGVYEKRTKWLKRCGRIADPDDYRSDDENRTATSGVSSCFQTDALSSTEKSGVAISIISDGLSNRAETPSRVNAGFVAGKPGSMNNDAGLNDHGGGVEAEVVLDPAALSGQKTPLVVDDQSHNHHKSAVVDRASPAWRESDIENNTNDVVSRQQSPLTPRHLRSSVTDHTEHSEPSPLSSDVDFLCSEIGRLVADHMRQHLVFFCNLAVKNPCKLKSC